MENKQKLIGYDKFKVTKYQRNKSSVGVGTILTDYETGRIPPQALDIEEAVLGALLLEKNALTSVIDILRPEVFYKEAHEIIYTAITMLFNNSEPIDLITVTNELRKNGVLEKVGGPFYITQLTHKIASAANIEFHAKIIVEKYIQRQLIETSSEIIRDSYEETKDVFELLDKAEANLFDISQENFRRQYEPMSSLIKNAMQDIENAMSQDGKLRGVPSGFTELDRITGGWQKTDLIIIAARPSMGKTAVALSMALNDAIKFEKPVAIFSLEMSATQLVTRFISSHSGIPISKLRKGDLSTTESQMLNQSLTPLINAPIYIDDTPALSIFELRAKCRRLKQQHNIQVVYIDYLQLMAGSPDARGNREQEISSISRSLKSLAKELDVPVIVLSQLNRGVETRASGAKKPILSDLRESGAIEQDADLVVFVYRPEVYMISEDEHGNPTAGLAYLIISKHRNGALGEVKLRFKGECTKFEDPDFFSTEEHISYIQNNQNFDAPKIETYASKMNDGDFALPPENFDEDIPFDN